MDTRQSEVIDFKSHTYEGISVNFDLAICVLHVSEFFHIESTTPKPNWWWRFWQYVLLGFTWEDI